MRQIPVIVFFLLTACSSSEEPSSYSSDQVFTNGRFYTVDEENPWAEAAVVRNGKFVYVGGIEGATSYIDGGASVTDLKGRLVIPGMVDAHTHPGQIDLIQFNAEFSADQRDTFLGELRDYAAANPGDDWVLGCCWPVIEFVHGDKGPDRIELDSIFPDRPVWINSNAGHSFWLNSKALEHLGLDETSKDPRFPVAMYKRDDDGRLTGWIKEGAGWQLMDEIFPVDSTRHESAVRDMLRVLNEHGVTTVFDAGNKDFNDRVYGFLNRLDSAGELPLRYEGTYRMSTPDRLQTGISELKRFQDQYSGKKLRFTTVKLFMDGIHENRSGAQIKPYADNPNHYSDTTVTVEQLHDYLVQLHEERLDIHIHVIGDLAIRRVLDAVEMATATVGPAFYPRVSVAHLQNVDQADWPRFRELDISANFTAWWMGVDEPDPVAAALGPEHANDTYRAAALFDAGANVTFSSDDWTLPVLSPFLGMQVAHTRQYPREWLSEEQDVKATRLPESEQISLERLIKGYTLNGAYQLRMENEIGSIEAGKLADMVILDEDLFSMDPYSIHKIRPAAVIMEGEVVQGSLQ